MSEQRTDAAAVRRWVIDIGRLRERVARSTRRVRDLPPETAELMESCLTLAESLLREFAAAELRAHRAAQGTQSVETAWRELFEKLPVACIKVDAEGTIARANAAAGVLLNTSTKHLENRPLLYFFQDRAAFGSLLSASQFEESSPVHSMMIRPRERAPVPVDAAVVCGEDNAAGRWWFLTPAGAKLRLVGAGEKLAGSGELEQSA